MIYFSIFIYCIIFMGNIEPENRILRKENLMTKIIMLQEKDIIEHLQQESFNIASPINQMGDTIGHYAAYKGLLKVLQYLIKKGDNFETANHRGLNAIDVALPVVRQWIYKNRK